MTTQVPCCTLRNNSVPVVRFEDSGFLLRRLDDQRMLFWNTYDANGVAHTLEGLDCHHFPREFHRHFENEVQ